MVTGDRALAQSKKGPFYYTLEEFSKYWGRIDIVCPGIKNQESRIKNIFNNVFIHSSSLPLIFQPFFILKKGRELYKRYNHNLMTVHSYPPFYNDIGGLWLHRKTGIPYISEIHHITGYPKAGDLKEAVYKIMTKFFVRCFTKHAKAVRAVNQTQVPEFLKKCGVPKEKIKVIPSFYINLDIFKPMPEQKKYDIVFCGRLAKNKGIFLLFSAIEKIKLQNPNIKLIIVGSGPLKEKIEKYAKNNNLEENIIFSGWLINLGDVAKIYNQSKIFVMPSYNEGGPRACLEAMACGIPIITTRVGAMIDLIKDNENGVFIDWRTDDIAKEIINLLKNNDLRNKISENGYATARQFERKKMIQNYALSCQKVAQKTFSHS